MKAPLEGVILCNIPKKKKFLQQHHLKKGYVITPLVMKPQLKLSITIKNIISYYSNDKHISANASLKGTTVTPLIRK